MTTAATAFKNTTHKSVVLSGVTLLLLLTLLTLLPTLAIAHSGHSLLAADAPFLSSILSGILHPLTGLDHLMLALGMGMLFTQMHRLKQGLVALLVGLMTGFVLSLSVSLNSLFVEYGIVLSIILLTTALMSRYFNSALNETFKVSTNKVSTNAWYSLVVIGFGALAMFHGAAHAIEVPTTSLTAGFFIGMMMAMLALYTVGKGVAMYLSRAVQDSLMIQRVIAVVGLCSVLLS